LINEHQLNDTSKPSQTLFVRKKKSFFYFWIAKISFPCFVFFILLTDQKSCELILFLEAVVGAESDF
jgi:hypothetical protein